MNLAQAVKSLGLEELSGSTLAGSDAAMLGVLDRTSPILITQNGALDDPGSPSSNWFYQLGQESIQRMLETSGGHSGAQANRHCWLGRSRPTFTKMAVMSQVTGLDNSRPLPPCFPINPGEHRPRRVCGKQGRYRLVVQIHYRSHQLRA